jgi:chromosome segregation protein
MGEQSAKQLRGRNMEDIIFNGAGEHKPLGMAEVSLTFENGDGSFPNEFVNAHELCITRRLFRSGESEYLINNVACRLKDIQEIFMDTGLGNKAYSIIGQGRISTIVEQKPEETRVMLEEAAGITKYKRKEAESRRKLELSRKNLHRVEDILVEVESQMRSLKRQAGKARRFKEIGRELKRLELQLNANIYHGLSDETGNRSKITEDLLEQEAVITADLSNIHARIEGMNLDLEEKDSGISKLRNTFLHIKEEFNRKEATLESIANEMSMLAELEERLNRDKEDLSRRLVTLGEQRLDLDQRVDRLKQESGGMESEISLVSERMNVRKNLLTEIKEDYANARAKVNSGFSRGVELSQESGYLNKRLNEITDNRARLENEKNDVDSKVSELLDVSRKKNEIRQALIQNLEDIERDIQGNEQKCEELKRVEKNIETELRAIESKFNASQTRLSSLKSLSDNFEGYNVGVRTVMKATDLKSQQEGRVLGLIADVIRVDSQYEQAVESVLADKLQCVIVENLEDGKEAVNYLKQKGKGRGSFVSLEAMIGQKNDFKTNGFPLLRDIVKVSEKKYNTLVDLLLGSTVIAPSLEEAITSWKSNGKNHTIVTVEGDMVDGRGIISGGRLTNRSHGLLARKREIGELEAQVAVYGKKVGKLRQGCEDIQHEMEEKRSALNLLREEKENCQEKVNELDQAIFRLSHELDQLERLSAKIIDDLEQRSEEQERHKNSLKKIETELKECEEKKREGDEYLLRKELELKECEEEFEEIQSEFQGLQVTFSRSREEEKGLVREMERIDEYIDEARYKQDRMEQDLQAGREKIDDCITRKDTLGKELKGFYDSMSTSEEAVKQAEMERNNFHAEIRELEKKSEAVRDELDHVKEKISMARMEQSEIQFKINNLCEVVRERFNLKLTDIFKDYLVEDFSETEIREEFERQKQRREKLGDVNLTAIQEHEALTERYKFIKAQKQDLIESTDAILQAIRKINRTCKERFMETFTSVNEKIKQVFPILFNGGTAGLKLTDEANPLESGVLVEVQPPGKKLSHMALLSGGEKALVAMTLLFAIYLIKPSPFCLLDEVDAPLDEANIDRFNNLIKEIRKHSQILMITHNRRSMEIVDSLYGVTMEKVGVSKMVTVNLSDQSMN